MHDRPAETLETAARDLDVVQANTNWAQAAIWSLIYGLTMLYCASLVRSRVVFIGGAILIASIVAANYSPAYVGYILAGGNLCGMAATGIVLMTARR